MATTDFGNPWITPEMQRKRQLAEALSGIQAPANAHPLAALAAGLARGYGVGSSADLAGQERQAQQDWQTKLAKSLSMSDPTAQALLGAGMLEPAMTQESAFKKAQAEAEAKVEERAFKESQAKAQADAAMARTQATIGAQKDMYGQRQAAAESKAEVTADKEARKAVMELRKELSANPVLRAYSKDVMPAVKAARSARELRNTAGDTALIKQVAKMTDPTSAVRDAEFAVTSEVGGYLERAKAIVDKATGAGFLTDQQRDELATVVDAVNAAWEDGAKGELEVARRYADAYNIPTEQVSPLFASFEKPSVSAAPSPASGPVKVNTKAEMDALPSGTKFIGPDGVVRSKR